jgi:hypothetical protein
VHFGRRCIHASGCIIRSRGSVRHRPFAEHVSQPLDGFHSHFVLSYLKVIPPVFFHFRDLTYFNRVPTRSGESKFPFVKNQSKTPHHLRARCDNNNNNNNNNNNKKKKKDPE